MDSNDEVGKIDGKDLPAKKTDDITADHPSGHVTENSGDMEKRIKKNWIFQRSIDTTDSLKELEISLTSMIFIAISLVAYVADIISDIVVISLLHHKGLNWWFGLMLSFFIIPSLVVNSFSVRWYYEDEIKPPKTITYKRPKRTRREKIAFVVFHLFSMGPALRYLELLYHAKRSRSQRNERIRKKISEPIGSEECRSENENYSYEEMMVYGNRDACMLSLIEAFLEGAPQLVLQIYILVIRGQPVTSHKSITTDVWQVISIMLSLFNMSWGLASYQRALRLSVINKRNIARVGQIVQFVWKLGIVSSRVFALALFTSYFKYWIAPILLGHWGVMTAWIIHMNTEFCLVGNGTKNHFSEYIFNMVMGAVYIFSYINLKEERTRYKYLAYYIIVFLENCVCISLWHHYSDSSLWYHDLAIAWVFLSFIVGIVFMLIYYSFYHPNGPMVVIGFKNAESSGKANSEQQTLFGVCCTSNVTSQSTEDNSTPLEPTNQSTVFTINEDGDAIKMPETGI